VTCYNPVSAFRLGCGSISFSERGDCAESIELPCGRCVGCRLAKSQEWQSRCVHEAQLHEFNCFVTLTYDDANLPEHGSLCYRDFQLFMKRLRKHFDDVRIRFFMAGEYGEQLSRPHYHAILFGIDFHDRVVFSKSASGMDNYVSDNLSRLWGKGFCTVSPFSPEAAGYIARYSLKKVVGDMARSHYSRLDAQTGELFTIEPEFARMSTRPGVGAEWFEKFFSDVFPHDAVVIDGSKSKPPRYYEKLAKRSGYDLTEIKENRVFAAYPKRSDNTRARLAVKEQVTMAAIQSLKRSI